MKFALRFIITTIFFLPSVPFILISVTAFGLLLTVPVIGLFKAPFCWLVNDKEGIQESKQMIAAGLYLLYSPIHFWAVFMQGRDPFKAINL